jgi:glutamyl-tRNA synthetase
LRTPDGDRVGYAEAGVTDYDPGSVVQFERVGFARIDAHESEGDGEADDGSEGDGEADDGSEGDGDPETVAYFAHG